jgi:hypothetical protein
MINVLNLLRPFRAAERAKSDDSLTTLAAKIVAGERMTPQEISAALDRVRATPEELQAEVDRQETIASLRESVRAGKGARRRLDEINGILAKSQRTVDEAQAMHDDLVERHANERQAMKSAVAEASSAADTLTRPEYLTPEQRGVIENAERAAAEDGEALKAARDALPRIADLIIAAEADYTRLVSEGASADQQAVANRTLEARRARHRKAADDVARLTKSIAEAVERRDAFYEEIRRRAEQ